MALGIGIGLGVNRSRPLSRLDAATKTWKASVIANGGTLNATDIATVETFILGAKSAGLWDLLDWIALFAGRNLNAALVPIKRTIGNAVMTNNNFVEANFSPTVGLTGDGTTKDLVPGFNANQLGRNSVFAAAFLTSLPATGGSSRGFFGTTFGSTPAFFAYRGSSGPLTARVHTTGSSVTAANAAIGFNYVRRVVNTAQIAAVGTSETSDATASVAPGANAIRIFSLNGGTYHNGAIGAAVFGQGLTSGQAASLRTLFIAAMTSLGRPTS